MAKKRVKLGSILSETKKRSDGTEYRTVYVVLGQNSTKSPDFNYSVEITVKNAKGQVVAKQTNGFISITDPRKAPEELLAAGVISEEQAEKMRERASKMPAKIKQELWVNGVE